MPNSWHRAAFIFCLCTDPGASPGGLESGVRQFISPRLNHWFYTISTAWFRCDVALEREIPLGDSIARSWLHLAECCGSVLSSVAKLDNAKHFDVIARTKHRLHPSGDKVHGQLNTPPRVPGTDLDLQFASIRPPHSRCLAPDPDPMFASTRPPHSRCLAPDPDPSLLASDHRHGCLAPTYTPCLLASDRPTAGAWHLSRPQIQAKRWCGPEKPLHRLATGGYGRRPPLPQRVPTCVVLGVSGF